MRKLLGFGLLATFGLCCGMAASRQIATKIGIIDLFGHSGLDEAAIRRTIPLRVGDEIVMETWRETQKGVAATISKAIGRKVTDVSLVGFDPEGRWMIFVGVAGPTVKAVRYRSLAGTKAELGEAAMKLYTEIGIKTPRALQSGGVTEDVSNGYSLVNHPEIRAIQLEMRRFALKNEALLREVLDRSRVPEQRRAASQMLGYALHSQEQIASLVRASLDPDTTVRNNAVRAIGVIAQSDPRMIPVIPASPYIDMVRSGTWTDRNKGAMVLAELTKVRDKRMLAQLRREAVPSLVEMSRWTNTGHRYTARIILARIAGFDDDEANRIIRTGDLSPIYRALGVE